MSITPFFHVYHKYVFNMDNISKIKISGTSYSIKDENACKVVELTQAEYDGLPATAKTSNSLFVITDATAGDLSNYYTKTETDGLLDTKLDVTAYTPTDLSNYYTKSETSGATEIYTALSSKADTATTYTKTETDNAITAATSTKQDTLVSGTNIKTINNESILGEGNIDIQGGGGGGKAIEAGRGISITTGETADTVSFNLPISAGTGTNALVVGSSSVTASGNKSFASGDDAIASGNWSAAFGRGKSTNNYTFSANFGQAKRDFSSAFGSSIANNTYGFATGAGSKANGHSSFVSGWNTNSNNDNEASFGKYNNSVSASTTFGDSGNTLFSVGNGTADNARHNAFEIRQNGDIYISKDGQDVKLQDQLGGGGSSYTAGDGIDITNDVISVTGKVDTSAFTAHTADTVIHVTSDEKAAWNGKQDALVSGTNIKTINNQSILGEGNITIEGGSGGESCTVDSTTMFYTFNGRYTNDALDMMARYVVLDYGQHKTDMPDTSIDVNFRDANYNTYVSQNISLNYSTSSYTLGDISQAEYIDVTYDSTIEDFKIAVATAYTSTVFVGYINFWDGSIKVPLYTISSGSPCTVIENDIPTAISELGNSMLKGLRQTNISSQKNAISIYTETFGGNSNSGKIKLDEIDGSGSTLKPDIYVGLGTSGWTEINLSEQCYIDFLKSTKYRVTYNNSELDSLSMGLQLTVEYAGNEVYDHITFDETKQPSLQAQDVFSAATLDWNASTKELVITYPETIELYGNQESVNISKIYSNGCNFGRAITKLESYGEEKQALKPYVKETRAALGGLKLVKLTQSEYDALATKDSSTLYIING